MDRKKLHTLSIVGLIITISLILLFFLSFYEVEEIPNKPIKVYVEYKGTERMVK
jgi:RsiW-degrading membrane proteinase PrsW (M82 family)